MSQSASSAPPTKRGQVAVAALREEDLPAAERICRIAFGTFFGAPEPEKVFSDLDCVRSRYRAPHIAAFGATLDGDFVGSNFATKWGSVGTFGPLTVRPDRQEYGIGQALLARTMAQFDAWAPSHVGLFTFAHSAKHVGLYQKFGFHPRFLTAIMAAPAGQAKAAGGWSRLSELAAAEHAQTLAACREITETIYPGLDLSGEIISAQTQRLGDTLLLESRGGLGGFAICHYGPTSEAGAGNCFVKFGAVRCGASAEPDYLRLLDACDAMAVAVGMPNVLAGTNMAREEAYRHLVARGFRARIQGVTMHRPNEAGYSRPGVYVLDDWR